MAMMKKTAEAIEKAKRYFASKEFTEHDWEQADIGLTLTTAIKYDAVKVIHHEERAYYTLQELVDALNNCGGEDCYDADWYYQIDENNRVYQLLTWKTYQMA